MLWVIHRNLQEGLHAVVLGIYLPLEEATVSLVYVLCVLMGVLIPRNTIMSDEQAVPELDVQDEGAVEEVAPAEEASEAPVEESTEA